MEYPADASENNRLHTAYGDDRIRQQLRLPSFEELDMAEVDWPEELVHATLTWTGSLGLLKFIGPDGDIAIISVTRGDAYPDKENQRNVWHIELEQTEDELIARVSPSIHYVGQWHTPNPVSFKVVGEL